MGVEIKIDSLDDMCDDNYLDSKQDDTEVKIKYLNIDMININYKLDLNRLNFYEPSYRYKKNFARNLLTGIYNGYKFYKKVKFIILIIRIVWLEILKHILV